MAKPRTVKQARQAAGIYLDPVQIENRLHMLGNGACIATWNYVFSIHILEGATLNGSRRSLASGGALTSDLFDRATVRLKELRDKGLVKT